MWKAVINFSIVGLFSFGVAMNASYADDTDTPKADGHVSLCKTEEYVVLSADVQAISADHTAFGHHRLVSLCADRPTEPFSTLAYRFGDAGAPDVTIMATPTDKFRLADDSYGPHDGADIVWFKRGPFSYYVSLSTGQGLGVDIYVFKNGKRIAEFGTGFDETKFYNGTSIDFDNVKSPIFVKQEPEDKLE
ncbi:MAG: hypothetical protein ACLPGW_00200 [Roseiarcus sp.]